VYAIDSPISRNDSGLWDFHELMCVQRVDLWMAR